MMVAYHTGAEGPFVFLRAIARLELYKFIPLLDKKRSLSVSRRARSGVVAKSSVSPWTGSGRFLIMSTSQLQEHTKTRLRQVLTGVCFQENYRPDWLKNPDTGYNLELDFWLPDFDTGIEVQGKQHNEFIPFFHGDEAGFEAQLQRDALKRRLCSERGVCVVNVYSPDDVEVLFHELCKSDPDLWRAIYKRNAGVASLAYTAARIAREAEKEKPNPDTIEGLTHKLIRTATKYNVPLLSIRPDFTLTKIQMAFYGRPIVKLNRYADGETVIRAQNAAALKWAPGAWAHLRWFNKDREIEDQYYDAKFDLATGQPTTDIHGDWRIVIDELPERLLRAA